MPKVVLLENVRSLHNVGAVFRTADGAGFNEVCLTGYTGCPPDRRIEKVSLGAENMLEWKHFESPIEAVTHYKSIGYTIWALEQVSTSSDLFSGALEVPEKLVLVLGNEVEGVSPEVLRVVDMAVEIPMRGQKGSLNVSVSAGIAMYQVMNLSKKSVAGID